MIHKRIIKNLDLFFLIKNLLKKSFENFNSEIAYGSRIGIIGRNGSGKSSLLKMIKEICEANEINSAIVSEVIVDHNDLTGSQRF